MGSFKRIMKPAGQGTIALYVGTRGRDSRKAEVVDVEYYNIRIYIEGFYYLIKQYIYILLFIASIY